MHKVQLGVDQARVVTVDAATVALLAGAPGVSIFGTMPPEMRDEVIAIAAAVNGDRPLVHLDRRTAVLGGRYHMLEVLGLRLGGGFVATTWKWAYANYTVSWANPAWDLSSCDPSVETVQISHAITEAIVASAAPHWEAPLSASIFQDVPVFTVNWWQWGVSVCRRALGLAGLR